MSIEYAIEVGARFFSDRGYSATTTRQLAEALGITNGTFYHYFASKEDLLRMICEHSLETMLLEVGDALEAEPKAGKLPAFIRQHMCSVLRQQELHKTMLTQVDRLGEDNRAKVIALRDQYETLVRETLEEARDLRIIRADIEIRMMTRLLLNLLNWTIFWFRQDGALTPTAVADLAEKLFMDGARPR